MFGWWGGCHGDGVLADGAGVAEAACHFVVEDVDGPPEAAAALPFEGVLVAQGEVAVEAEGEADAHGRAEVEVGGHAVAGCVGCEALGRC